MGLILGLSEEMGMGLILGLSLALLHCVIVMYTLYVFRCVQGCQRLLGDATGEACVFRCFG